MGRREQGADAVGFSKASSGAGPPSGEHSGRAWQAVRRALGRLAAHVSVRDLPPSAMTPPVAVRVLPFGPSTPVTPGGSEGEWKPWGEVRQAPVPQAVAGARDGEPRPAVRLTEGRAAFVPPLCREMPVVQTSGCRTESADLLLPAFIVRLPDSFLALPADPVRVRSAALPAPRAAAPRGPSLEGWGVLPPRIGALGLPRVPAPRVLRGDDAVMGRIALTRRGLEPPDGTPFALAFEVQAQRLAEAAHLPPEDVTLLGVYPGVPILAVSRIVVADEGRRLRLWLKPDILRGRGGTRLITLLVGRQTSSGKMLQGSL